MNMRATALLLTLSTTAFVGAGCGQSPSVATSEAALVQISSSSCVDLLAGQTIVAGTVCSAIEGNDLKITYATTDGWKLYEAHLWSGLSLSQMPQTNSGNPKLGNFPYKSGALAGVESYTILVPLSVFGLDSSMTECDPRNAFIVAHAVVKKQAADGSYQAETAYGSGSRLVQRGSWATFYSLLLTCKADDPVVEPGQCETAFAFGGDSATCFIGSGLLDSNRWGWTNGPIGAGDYAFAIYAGAGRCDLTKGTEVGTLFVSYDGATATVRYSMKPGYVMDETHLYVGSEPLARDPNGEYTVAPGQYPGIHDLTNAASDTFVVTGLSGNIYVVAHAVTCSAS